MKVATRRPWHNHARDQECLPLEICWPTSEADLVDLVRSAEQRGVTVHPVGSGHAWSEAALTDGILVETSQLTGVSDVPDPAWKHRPASTRLVRVRAGTTIRALNSALEVRGLALPNMGGYDAQSLAGVVATSTHGSGLTWGPFPSFVRSLDQVISGGRSVRIEPADGITDPKTFAAHHRGRTLIQDDDRFAAAVCGLGLMGLVFELTIEVRSAFWMQEVRTLSTWEAVRDELTPERALGRVDPAGHPTHYELLLNPYARGDGQHAVIVTERSEHADPAGMRPDQRRRHPMTERLAHTPAFRWLIRRLARHVPWLVGHLLGLMLSGLRDDSFAGRSYEVMNIGAVNELPGYSMELAVSIDDGRHVACIERVFAIAACCRDEHGWYSTSPIALRFVAASPALASMMYDRRTMMIELVMIEDTRGGRELLATYQRELAAEFGARAHWGQFNVLQAVDLPGLYPRWDDWLAVHRELNASGVFTTPLARELGITPHAPAPAGVTT